MQLQIMLVAKFIFRMIRFLLHVVQIIGRFVAVFSPFDAISYDSNIFFCYNSLICFATIA
jgi:hypothetical protein